MLAYVGIHYAVAVCSFFFSSMSRVGTVGVYTRHHLGCAEAIRQTDHELEAHKELRLVDRYRNSTERTRQLNARATFVRL